MERCLARAYPRDAVRQHVHRAYLMPQRRQAHPGRQSHVARSHDRYSHCASLILLSLRVLPDRTAACAPVPLLAKISSPTESLSATSSIPDVAFAFTPSHSTRHHSPPLPSLHTPHTH